MGDHAATSATLLAAALAAWPSSALAVRRRVRRLEAPARRPPTAPRARLWASTSPTTRRWLVAVAAGTSAGVLLGGAWGPLVGAAAALAVERVLRRQGGASTRGNSEPLLQALPLACDLLAVCLQAGIPPGAAIAAVAEASPQPLRAVLSRVSGLYRLGAEPSRAWDGVPPPLDGLVRAFVRAGGSGSGVVPALAALASDTRAGSRARTEAALQRAGVWVLAPLGACFLPAFLCLGVVPLVLGIAHGVFG